MAAVQGKESELWDELRDIIGYHDKPGDDCFETLNRLLHKHPLAKPRQLAIRITPETHRLSAESWNPERLWQLILPSQVTQDPPRSAQEAVIVARFDGADFLIDGRRRINYWKREGLPWERRVLVIEAAPGHRAGE